MADSPKPMFPTGTLVYQDDAGEWREVDFDSPDLGWVGRPTYYVGGIPIPGPCHCAECQAAGLHHRPSRCT